MIHRILQIHTRYRQPGGEDGVVEAERRLLEEAGISVHQLLFDNASIPDPHGLAGNLGLAASAIWSRSAERDVRRAFRTQRPDVVHVHNTFVAASPSVYRAVPRRSVVQTLHNYRLVCPVATAFRDGRPCTDCVGRSVALPAVVHACVGHSRARSAVAAATTSVHRAIGTFDGGIGAYIALTGFQRALMIEGGLPADRIRVIPNFHEPDPGAAGPGAADPGGTDPARGDGAAAVLYVGRLATEKGVEVLMAAAARQPGLVRIAGDGPLAARVRRAADAGDVVYLGRISAPAVRTELRRARALVVPSLWFEGFPLVVLEAYAAGTPVIASRLGSLGEIVEDGMTGLLVPPNDPVELGTRIRWATDHPAELAALGAGARHAYLDRYRGSSHLAALLETYEAVASKLVAVHG